MRKIISRKGGAAVVFAAIAVVGSLAAYMVASASADGRTLDATFCSGLCIQVASDDQTVQGVMGGDAASHVLTLRPGTYWLTVTDNSNFHNFNLRSCPGAAVLCDVNSGGQVLPLTPLGNGATPTITQTLKIDLKHGTYRLYCNAARNGITHEQMGMYVDFEVGGVGQVG